jgi:hypothetical protein
MHEPDTGQLQSEFARRRKAYYIQFSSYAVCRLKHDV